MEDKNINEEPSKEPKVYKKIIIICVGIILLSAMIYGLISMTNQKPSVIEITNTTEQPTNQPVITQPVEDRIGCQYDNPKCEGGYKCVNNKCSEIQHHSGGGGGSGGIVVIPGGGGIS